MAAVDIAHNDDDQPMSLKVMRLSRPEITSQMNIYFEVEQERGGIPFLPGLASQKQIHNSNFELYPALSVPTPCDTIYLGETFSCYLSINNEIDKVLQYMTLKVELQATYKHFSLIDTTITPINIEANSSAQYIVHHEVKELGMHFLLCSIHYVTPNQERKFFKKIYKVNVLNPLAVKTKANNLLNGIVLLEVQVQNLSNANMFLENLKLEPNPLFEYQDLNFIFNEKEEFEDKFINEFNNKSDLNKQEVIKNQEKQRVNKESNLTSSEKINLEKQSNEEQVDPTVGLQIQLEEQVPKEPWEIELPKSPIYINEEEEKQLIMKNNEEELNKQTIIQRDEAKDLTQGKGFKEESKLNLDQDIISQPSKEEINKIKLKSIFGQLNYLRSHDIRQYLYKLIPKNINNNLAYTSNELGKLDIIWKTRFGGSGRLQTSQLTRRVSQIESINLIVMEIQKQIYLDIPFKIQCKIINRTNKVMHIELSIDKSKSNSLLFKGISPMDLGPIESNHFIQIELCFLPLIPGFHKIGNIKLMDMFTNTTTEIDLLTEVFVAFGN